MVLGTSKLYAFSLNFNQVKVIVFMYTFSYYTCITHFMLLISVRQMVEHVGFSVAKDDDPTW